MVEKRENMLVLWVEREVEGQELKLANARIRSGVPELLTLERCVSGWRTIKRGR